VRNPSNILILHFSAAQSRLFDGQLSGVFMSLCERLSIRS